MLTNTIGNTQTFIELYKKWNCYKHFINVC